MTIAISLKVHDGVVLAADSASTLSERLPNGQSSVVNVYNNANKIVNLYKGLPLGVITWGGGSIGPVSITTVYKDLRGMLCGATPGPGDEDWTLNPANYAVLHVAERARQYLYDHLYTPAFTGWSEPPEIGLIVAGFSSGGQHAEEYQINMSGPQCAPPKLLRDGADCGFTVGGQPEAIARLVLGVDPSLGMVFEQHLGIDSAQVPAILAIIQQQLQLPLVQDAMPFQDALDLAEFLVGTTIKMSKFMPGAGTVGGPIEIAGITKHEGFRWVERKHYYKQALNPKDA